TIPASVGNTVFENQPFDPAGKAKIYKFFYMPSAPEVATLGSAGQDRFTGLIQIDICIPVGAGKTGIAADVDALRAKFFAGSRLIDGALNVIVKACGLSSAGYRDEPFHCYPSTI